MSIDDWVKIATITGNFAIAVTLVVAAVSACFVYSQLKHIAKTRNADLTVRLFEILHGPKIDIGPIVPILIKRQPVSLNTLSDTERGAVKALGSFLELIAVLVNTKGLDTKMVDKMWGRDKVITFFDVFEEAIRNAQSKEFRSTLTELETLVKRYKKDC